jgi:protein-L-isoaspartate(D-aspartate) O-methyltransferase
MSLISRHHLINPRPLFWTLLWLCALTAQAAPDDYARERRAMVDAIAADARETRSYIGKQALDPAVMAAMGRVPRHAFVPDDLVPYAYRNKPLPIGHGQTISQPYIVALMTDLLGVDSNSRVLEIGTGSGYQAAILGELVAAVYTLEIVEPLADSASERLARLGYDNVHTRFADGYYGWPEQAPFDAIIVTAAADHVPPPLLEQLKPGGRMLIPVGSRFMTQELTLVEKQAGGRVISRQLLPVVFVPLTGEH